MIGYPSSRELTQGTIFTCASSEDYFETSPKGIVITARCDVSHGKAPVISYIPIADFRSWLFRDGVRVLASRVIAANRGNMRMALREVGLSESVLDTITPQIIRDHMSQLTQKSQIKAAERYENCEISKNAAEAALAAAPGSTPTMDLLNAQSKEYNKLVQDLLSNGLSDYHFIDKTEPNEDCEGYVALLREIRYLPASLASHLKDGIDFQLFLDLCRNSPNYMDKLIISHEDHYAMPVGLLQSPFIELFMQRFTHLYARIGVADLSPDRVKTLRAILPLKLGDDS